MTMTKSGHRVRTALLLASSSLALAGCGGGGGSPSEDPEGPEGDGSILVDGSGADSSQPPTTGSPDGDGSSGGDGTPPDPQTSGDFSPLQGVFRVSDRVAGSGRSLSFSGGFIRNDAPPAGHDIFLERDVCDPLSDFRSDFELRDTVRGEVGISAGDNLVVSNAGGTLATVPRAGDSLFEDYFLDDVVVDRAGATDLVLDVPGEVYPAWSNVPIPDGTLPTGMQPPLSASVTADTVFRWEAGTSGASHVGIGASFVAGDVTYSLNCFGPDDGEFAIPSGLRQELGDAVADGWSIDRRVFVDFREGDAYLEVQRYVDP